MLWGETSANANSVGNLVLHLCGNVRQWIGSGEGGQPDLRERDSEFSARGGAQPADLSQRLQSTISDATGIIRNLAPERLAETRSIQKYDGTLMEAILDVVEHFS